MPRPVTSTTVTSTPVTSTAATPAAPATAPAPAGAAAGAPARTLALTSAATFMALMTYTAPMVTLSDTAAALGTSLSVQAWLLNGTPLGLAALLLVAGSLADDYGRRRVFLYGTYALGVTTALGALATSTWMFTLARVVQGAASAAVLAASLGLLAQAYPAGPGRIRATGVWGACVSGGIALSPVVSGALATLADWRLPYAVMGLATLAVGVLGPRALTESRAPRPGRPDLAGAVTFGLALVALLAALTLGRDGWLRAPVGVLLGLSAALLAVFTYVERRARTPMLDLGLLRRPLFLASTAGGLFTGLSVIALFSYLPTVLQHTMGLTAMGTAWLFVLWSGTGFLVALQARRLAGRVTARHQLAAGFLLHAVAAVTMLGAAADSWPRLLPGLLVSGAGSGLLNAALPLLAVESVPPGRAAMGSGAGNTARYIGSAAGVALMIAVSTASGSSPAALAHGADVALAVSAGLGVLAALTVVLPRDRRR
ncbi:MFS transporter [Streptomyces longispororuber]|uniref:MFS transporter n=1 Tax=Streptomyces longispororuber TaxID=68230 RepID=UPI003F55DEC0